MKFNFKKIATVLGSALMIGSTMGLAAAANYPSPFVVSGAGDVGVVIGANSMDMAYATTITADLSSKISASASAGVTTLTGGDNWAIEKANTRLHLGNGTADIITTVDDDELPNLLAEGKYTDDDNDEFDYTQKITLANNSITLFDDNDYKEDTPTVAMKITNGAHVLTYILDFSDNPLFSDLETSELPIMGKKYYVLDNGTGSGNTTAVFTLLDSAETAVLSEGETKTITVNGKSYTMSIAYISTTEVKLSINGETTSTVQETQTAKLSDGTYIGIKDIMARDVAGSIGSVEFGIGAGKLKITSGADIELNDVSITNINATIQNTTGADTKLDQILISWRADGDLFVAPDSEITMPGFGNVKMSWGGIAYPVEEEFSVTYSGDDAIVLDNFPLKDSVEDIYLVYGNSTRTNITGIGKDDDNQLRTAHISPLTFDGDTDEYFVMSYKSGQDAESYLMRATGFKVQNSINKTTLQYRKDGAWVDKKTDAKTLDTVSIGSVDFTISTIDYAAKTVEINWSAPVYTDLLYSKEGLEVQLPWTNSTAYVVTSANETYCGNSTAVFPGQPGLVGPINITNGTDSSSTGRVCYATTWILRMREEDKDDTIANGIKFNVTAGFNSAATAQLHITDMTGELPNGGLEQGDSEVYRAFVYSALATEFLWDKGGDQDYTKVIYHGSEVPVKVYLASSSATVIGGSGSTAIQPVYDTAIDSVKAKNLIVVGGSCINTVAAKLLGSATPVCGSAFTTLTGADAGQFIIQSFDAAAAGGTAGKVALLVAGYEKEDTQKAATYLVNKVVDSATGKKYLGTSATEATLVV